jgi:hypothetical protein
MNAKEAQMELLRRLAQVISKELEELESANARHAVPAVAWISRNLLELGVWTGYCVRSEQNAIQFRNDAARDAVHALKIPEEFSNDAIFSFSAARKELIEKGNQDGIEGIDEGFMAVRDAAKVLGVEKIFGNMNKILSKFAHPTAMRVVSSEEASEVLRPFFFKIGKNWGIQALSLIDDFLNTSGSSRK